jgi:hypothetical protein
LAKRRLGDGASWGYPSALKGEHFLETVEIVVVVEHSHARTFGGCGYQIVRNLDAMSAV